MACVLSAVAAAFSGVPEEFCVNPHQTFESLSLVSALVRLFCGPAVFPFDLFPIFAQQHWYFYSGFNIPGLCERFRIINVPWPFQGLVTWILFIFLSRCFGRAIDRWYETKWVSDALFPFLFFWVVCCFFSLDYFSFCLLSLSRRSVPFFGTPLISYYTCFKRHIWKPGPDYLHGFCNLCTHCLGKRLVPALVTPVPGDFWYRGSSGILFRAGSHRMYFSNPLNGSVPHFSVAALSVAIIFS